VPDEHSKFSPSSASIWMTCAGSQALSDGLPDESSVFAEEGTAAHSLGEMALQQGKNCVDFLGQKIGDFEVDASMAEHVQVYVNFCREMWLEFPDSQVSLESRIIWDPDSRFGGTIDCLVRIPSQKLLRVIDLKYGAGVPVDVSFNSQLMCYALLAWQGEERIESWIVQPRCEHSDGPLRSHFYTADELQHFKSEILDAVKLTDEARLLPKDQLPLVTGSHCRWCKALAICPQQRKELMDEAIGTFQPIETRTTEELADLLDKEPQIMAYLKAAKALATSEILAGRPVRGRKLVQGLSNRKWRLPPEKMLKKFSNKKIKRADVVETKLKSPTQLYDLVEKAAGKGWIDQFITRDLNAPTLVSSDDKRDPYVPPKPTDAFEVKADLSFLR
jgi:hypothetical protein